MELPNVIIKSIYDFFNVLAEFFKFSLRGTKNRSFMLFDSIGFVDSTSGQREATLNAVQILEEE